MRNSVSNKRDGFTLIEVILAIVVVAVIMGIAIPKVMSNSDKAQIKQVISSDVRSIVAAAADWKRTDRTTANGVYTSISGELLDSRLPSNMAVVTADQQIKSSGFNGGCVFALAGDGTGKFKMGMDCSTVATNLAWDAKLKAYAREAFFDTVKSLSSNAAKDVGVGNTVSGSSGTAVAVACDDTESICATGITQ